jgi:dimethylaniline monooxygenase (N-oxide forming)
MFQCIVIGAGPAGIVATKGLLEHGVENVLCIEQSNEIGGIYSNGYDGLTMTSSSVFSMFSDFWIGDDKNHHFWSKNEACEYWTKYSEHFGVSKHIRLNSEVTQVRDLGETWQIELDTDESLMCERLILATGVNRVPNYPEWAKDASWLSRSHSRDYKNPYEFRGKKVLVIGGGESASDIAYDISSVAEKCWVSLRSSTGWVVPRRRCRHAADTSTHRGVWGVERGYGEKLTAHLLNSEKSRSVNDPVFKEVVKLNQKVKARKGIWGTYGTKTVALPKAIARFGCSVIGGIVKVDEQSKTITSSCGEVLDDLDAVVYCTGYKSIVSFMPEELQSFNPRELFKHVFHHSKRDRIALIGRARPNFGSQFPIMEMQARYIAGVFSGLHKLPSNTIMDRLTKHDEAVHIEQFEQTSESIKSLVDYMKYMDDMASLIGCEVPLYKYFWRHPRLWLKLVYGPAQATQFRLNGPGKKVEIAHDILRKIPTSTFNHVVKAGLRARLYYLPKQLMLCLKKILKVSSLKRDPYAGS